MNGNHRQSSLSVLRILLVEDDFFLAFDLQEELLLRGAEVIGPVGDLDRASSLAKTVLQIDVALTDLNLHGELAFQLIDELVTRDILVAVTTGYDREVVPYRLRRIPRFLKAVPAREIVDGIVKLVAQYRSSRESGSDSAHHFTSGDPSHRQLTQKSGLDPLKVIVPRATAQTNERPLRLQTARSSCPARGGRRPAPNVSARGPPLSWEPPSIPSDNSRPQSRRSGR